MKTICQRSKTTTTNEGPHACRRLCGAQLPQGGVCWAGWWCVFGLVLVGAIGTAAGAAEQSCERYATFDDLPDSFKWLSVGQLPGAEFWVRSDANCTCDNGPDVDRQLGKAAPEGVNWSCRKATASDRAMYENLLKPLGTLSPQAASAPSAIPAIPPPPELSKGSSARSARTFPRRYGRHYHGRY